MGADATPVQKQIARLIFAAQSKAQHEFEFARARMMDEYDKTAMPTLAREHTWSLGLEDTEQFNGLMDALIFHEDRHDYERIRAECIDRLVVRALCDMADGMGAEDDGDADA